MSKLVCRIEKKKSVSHVKAALNHNYREKNKASTQSLNNVNLNLSHLNQHFKNDNVEDAFNEYAELFSQETQRKNAVHAIEYIFTAEKSYFENMTHEDLQEFFKTAVDFVSSEISKDQIFSAVLHLDESTPHVHIMTTCLDDKKKANFKNYYKNKYGLECLQTRAAAAFEHLDLERGTSKRITQAEHANFRQFQNKILSKARDNSKHYKDTAINVLDKIKNMKLSNLITKTQRQEFYNSIKTELQTCEINKSQLISEKRNNKLTIELNKSRDELKLETEFKNKIKKELKEVKTENNDLKNQIRLSKELVEKYKKENEELKTLSQKYDFINAAIEKAKVLEKKDQEQKQMQEQEQKKIKNIRSM